MSIRLYNTPARELQEFTPQDDTAIKLYTCGPTVYDYPHVGNWSGYIYWDILVRLLMHNELIVERVMNITDVGHLVSDADDGEDKLEKGAKREGKTAWEVADFYTKDFLDGIKKLNLITPTRITKATKFIEKQIELVEKLERKGYTYTISDGVYFDTSKFPTYADFAHLNTDALKTGARVTFNQEKRNPTDFALWKLTPAGEKRDMEWESPWGKGFPGWHLECSAMAMDILGDTLDIHTGGIDHIPVHHTNEIAQSEAATGEPFSRFWLHNNHLKVNGTKISKSLENGFTLEDIAKKGFTPEYFRLFVLQSHYRTEGNFTWENLQAAKNRLQHWREAAELRWQQTPTKEPDMTSVSLAEERMQPIITALEYDLDTPKALSAVDTFFTKVKEQYYGKDAIKTILQCIDDVLGFTLVTSTPDITTEQKKLIEARRFAREEKNWDQVDVIKQQLLEQGIGLRDGNNNTLWYRTNVIK